MIRRVLVGSLALALLLVALPAWAGSYLNRAALLLDGARAERDMVRPRVTDTELVELVHQMAVARTRAGSRMAVPKQMVPAHPHLLLVLENCERAYSAARRGNHQKFVVHITRARTEDRTFRALVTKLGYGLPSTVVQSAEPPSTGRRVAARHQPSSRPARQVGAATPWARRSRGGWLALAGRGAASHAPLTRSASTRTPTSDASIRDSLACRSTASVHYRCWGAAGPRCDRAHR